MSEFREGDWMQTISGRRFWPIDPRPEDVHIEDIAHALAMMCRFNGHCTRFYSVAEHSVLVSQHVPREHAMWGLLHDASEAYIADLIRPAKAFVDGYKHVEARIMDAVALRFDLPSVPHSCIKQVDSAILADEASQIMGPAPEPWFLPEQPLGIEIVGLTPDAAKAAFLDRYYEIVSAGVGHEPAR